MNERTKTIVNWVIPIIIAGIVLLLILVPNAFEPFSNAAQRIGHLMTDPAAMLHGYATRNAINQFGGDISTEGFNSALLYGLMGITLTFVLAPSLMIFGYKKSKHSDGALYPITWHLGTGIVIAALSIGVYSSVSWVNSNETLSEYADWQNASDQLQFELIDLYFDAAAQAILPHEKGGGNGSFTNFVAEDGSTRNIQLSDLPRYNPDSKFGFVISDNITDSTITITGVSNYDGGNPDFQNANGSTGKLQFKLTVNPFEESSLKFKKENKMLLANN